MIKENYNKYDLKYFTISTIISTILITIIYNFKIDFYLRSFIIPITIILITYLINLKHNKLIINKNTLYILIPIFLIILNSFIFKVDISNKLLNIVILPITITYFILFLINSIHIFNFKNICIFIEDSLSNLFSNLNKINILFKKDSKNQNILNIIIGLLIGIPICIILILLLKKADSYFDYFIQNIINNLFNLINIKFIWKNIFIIFFSFILTFSLFISFMVKRKDEITENKIIKLSNITVSTILLLMNLVFMLFLITEISKLTTNFLHIPIEYTYAEYAREGFFQLLFITSINFIIILFIIYKTNLKDNKIIKKLLLILIGFSILLIFNSYYRMFLYINAYTFTILRMQVILFLMLELIIFILLIKKIISNIKSNNLKLYIKIFIIFYIINLYLCNKTIINLINKIIN